MATSEIEIRPGLRLAIEVAGHVLKLSIFADGTQVGPIEMTKEEAILVGGDIWRNGRSDRLAIDLAPDDAHLLGERLSIVAAEE